MVTRREARQIVRPLIEQAAIDLSDSGVSDEIAAMTSIAISLKRIADLLEFLVEQRKEEDP